jgi:ATP-dependent exoDNAse (exonuclease V) alpha subunit
MDQKKVIELALSGHNIFLTGKAGTGKTYTVNKIIEAFKKQGKIIAKTASTGIASTHINGTTIHSWAGIGIKDSLQLEDLYKLQNNKFSRERIESADVLIIDEISMLHDFRLDLIEQVCSFIRGGSGAFGGLQVIASGDFFQLPPVDKNNKKNYCFNSSSWKYGKFKTCYLDKVYRQNENDELTHILNSIRLNSITKKQKETLRSLKDNDKHIDKSISIFCKNYNVDILNATELSKIKGDSVISRMVGTGIDFKQEQLRKNITAPEVLILKKGAKVMHLVNDFSKNLVNGTLGEITDLSKINDGIVKFKVFKTKEEIAVGRNKWEIQEYSLFSQKDEAVASVSQFPFRLAWGLTVHKSQGAGFDYASIDLSDTFVENMGYVALSRVSSIDGLHLSGINDIALSIDPYIVEKDQEFKKESEANEKL